MTFHNPDPEPQPDYLQTVRYFAGRQQTDNQRGIVQLNALAQYRLGVEQAKSGNWSKAAEHMQAALVLGNFPDIAGAYNVIGMSHHKLGQCDLAEAAYTNAMVHSSNPAHQFERAIVREILRNFLGAIEDTNAVIAKGHCVADAKFLRAVCYQKLRQWPQAIAGFKEVIAIDQSRRAQALNHCAECQINSGDRESGMDTLNQAIGLNAKSATSHILRSDIWLARGDLDSALADINQAIQIDPNRATAYSRRCTILVARAEMDLAMRDANESIRLNPRLADGYAQRAKLFLRQKLWAEALADLQALGTLRTLTAEDCHDSAACYLSLGHVNTAMIWANKSFALEPSSAHPLIIRARCWLGLSQYNLALADVNQAINLVAGNKEALAEALHHRGMIYACFGRYREAVTDFSTAIRLNPKNKNLTEIYSKRGCAYRRLNLPVYAMRDFNRVIELDPQDAEAYAFRGNLQAESQRFDAALRDFDKAIEMLANDWDLARAVIQHERAEIYILQAKRLPAGTNGKLLYRRALSDLTEIIENYDNADGGVDMGSVYRMRAKCHLRLGDRQAAEQDRQIARSLRRPKDPPEIGTN